MIRKMARLKAMHDLLHIKVIITILLLRLMRMIILMQILMVHGMTLIRRALIHRWETREQPITDSR